MTIENIYDGLKRYIEDNLEPYLEALETSDISLPMYKNILRSSVYDIMGLQLYPTLMMEYGRIAVTRETTSADRYQIPITIYSIVKGGDSNILQKMNERYVWALKQMFENDTSLNNLVGKVDIQGYEFSPSLKRQNTIVHAGLLYIVIDTLLNKE